VPFWFYVASNLSMRLHGVHAFDAFSMVVRAGGNAFRLLGLGRGARWFILRQGIRRSSCEGFNRKNHYDRQSPCDPDFLRKMAKDTDAQALMRWFGGEGVGVFRRHRAFDEKGFSSGSASYLFVPDNPRYEGSSNFSLTNTTILSPKSSYRKMSDEQKSRCQWRRCYKIW